MKKVLLFSLLMIAGFSSKAINPINIAAELEGEPQIEVLTPEMSNMTAENFLALTPKTYKEMTGKKLGIKKTLQLKAAQKLIKSKMNKGEDIEKGLYIILVIFGLGFIAMGLMDDWDGQNWWMNLILTALCWLPGLIHGLVKMKDYYPS